MKQDFSVKLKIEHGNGNVFEDFHEGTVGKFLKKKIVKLIGF